MNAVCRFLSSLWKVPTETGVGRTEISRSTSVVSAERKGLSEALLDNSGIVSRVACIGEPDDNEEIPAELASHTACRYHNRMRDTIEEYNMAICGERAHGHLRSRLRRGTISRLRVRTESRSNVRAGTPSEMAVEGLAQYNQRMMSLVSKIQLGRMVASAAVADVDMDVDVKLSLGFRGAEPLPLIQSGDEVGVSALRPNGASEVKNG